MNDRRRRTRHRPRVHNEQDRRAEELGDVGGRSVLPASALPVEEPHDTFNQRNICIPRAVCEERPYEFGAGEEGVEVAPGPAGGGGGGGGGGEGWRGAE